VFEIVNANLPKPGQRRFRVLLGPSGSAH
jgi:hypothetical protein